MDLLTRLTQAGLEPGLPLDLQVHAWVLCFVETGSHCVAKLASRVMLGLQARFLLHIISKAATISCSLLQLTAFVPS